MMSIISLLSISEYDFFFSGSFFVMKILVFLTLLASVILANFCALVRHFTLVTLDFSMPRLFYFQASVLQSCCSLCFTRPSPHFLLLSPTQRIQAHSSRPRSNFTSCKKPFSTLLFLFRITLHHFSGLMTSSIILYFVHAANKMCQYIFLSTYLSPLLSC